MFVACGNVCLSEQALDTARESAIATRDLPQVGVISHLLPAGAAAERTESFSGLHKTSRENFSGL